MRNYLWLLVIAFVACFAMANNPGTVYVQLTWNAETGSGITYNLYRGSTSSGCGPGGTPLVTGITTNAYTDNAVSAATQYTYQVTAVQGGVESGCSNSAQLTVPSPPSAPTGLQGTAY